MTLGTDARRVALIAGAAFVFMTTSAFLFWRRVGTVSPRPVSTWSGTIASGGVAGATESEPPRPVVIIEQGHTDLEVELNRHWLGKVNALRKEKGLRALRVDQRLVATAKIWADEMASRREVTHERLDGHSMHQWIDARGLPFTERGGEFGWKTNYFVENIARMYAEPTPGDMRRALDDVLAFFLTEGPGGDHYESVLHLDWNSVGLGFAFDPVEPGRAYFVFHYGSLK